MIIALKITKADQEQAAKLLPLLPAEERVLIAIESGTEISFGLPENWKSYEWNDNFNSFPQTDNAVFQEIALYCKDILKAPFLYLTANMVPMRPTWFEELNALYTDATMKRRKPFVGDLMREASMQINVMSPVGIYPPNISQFAGEMMLAHDDPWSIAGGNQVRGWFEKTPLIRWMPDGLTFDKVKDSAIAGPDRDGSLFNRVWGKTLKRDAASQIVERDAGIATHDQTVIWEKPDITPWADQEESEQEIKRLCAKLRTYQTSPPKTHRVRMELALFEVTPGDTRIKRMMVRRQKLGPEFMK